MCKTEHLLYATSHLYFLFCEQSVRIICPFFLLGCILLLIFRNFLYVKENSPVIWVAKLFPPVCHMSLTLLKIFCWCFLKFLISIPTGQEHSLSHLSQPPNSPVLQLTCFTVFNCQPGVLTVWCLELLPPLCDSEESWSENSWYTEGDRERTWGLADVLGSLSLPNPRAVLALNFIICKKMNPLLFKPLWVGFAATSSQRHSNQYTPWMF